MKNLHEYLNLNEGISGRKTSNNPKDVTSPLAPAIDYRNEIGIIIGGVWNINHRSDMNNARTMIKALGLEITIDIDDITGYGDNTSLAWDNGHDFVYFYSPLTGEVISYIFDNSGVIVLK